MLFNNNLLDWYSTVVGLWWDWPTYPLPLPPRQGAVWCSPPTRCRCMGVGRLGPCIEKEVRITLTRFGLMSRFNVSHSSNKSRYPNVLGNWLKKKIIRCPIHLVICFDLMNDTLKRVNNNYLFFDNFLGNWATDIQTSAADLHLYASQ